MLGTQAAVFPSAYLETSFRRERIPLTNPTIGSEAFIQLAVGSYYSSSVGI